MIWVFLCVLIIWEVKSFSLTPLLEAEDPSFLDSGKVLLLSDCFAQCLLDSCSEIVLHKQLNALRRNYEYFCSVDPGQGEVGTRVKLDTGDLEADYAEVLGKIKEELSSKNEIRIKSGVLVKRDVEGVTGSPQIHFPSSSEFPSVGHVVNTETPEEVTETPEIHTELPQGSTEKIEVSTPGEPTTLGSLLQTPPSHTTLEFDPNSIQEKFPSVSTTPATEEPEFSSTIASSSTTIASPLISTTSSVISTTFPSKNPPHEHSTTLSDLQNIPSTTLHGLNEAETTPATFPDSKIFSSTPPPENETTTLYFPSTTSEEGPEGGVSTTPLSELLQHVLDAIEKIESEEFTMSASTSTTPQISSTTPYYPSTTSEEGSTTEEGVSIIPPSAKVIEQIDFDEFSSTTPLPPTPPSETTTEFASLEENPDFIPISALPPFVSTPLPEEDDNAMDHDLQDDPECIYEDTERFRRNVGGVTYAIVHGHPALLTFDAGSSCFSILRKGEPKPILKSLRRILPRFPKGLEVISGAYFDGQTFLIDSSQDQNVWILPKDLSSDSKFVSIIPKSTFLSTYCSFSPSNLPQIHLRSLLVYNSSCLLYSKDSHFPIFSPNASSITLSLAQSITHLLDTEFLDFPTGFFTWQDQGPTPDKVYLFGSNGELYSIYRNPEISEYFHPTSYSIMPYEQSPF